MRMTATLGLLLMVAMAVPVQAGNPFIKLSGVPSKLRVPIPDDTNMVITAEVKNAKVRVVWMALAPDASSRVMLNQVDEATFQINLRDPSAQGLLASAQGQGQFQIFAELEDRKLISSITVYYSVDRPNLPVPSLMVKKKNADAIEYRNYGCPRWLAPERVEKLFWQTNRNPPASAVANAGKRHFRFKESKDKGLELNVNREVQQAWIRHGSLEIRYSGTKGVKLDRKYCILKIPPGKLDLKGNVGRLRIYQRSWGTVPGSEGYLLVRLGDITGGQVRLTLEDFESRPLLSEASVTQGQHLSFRLDKQAYTLTMDKLINRMFDSDYANLVVYSMPPKERDRIEALLRHLAASKVSLVREGKVYSALQAAARLRTRFETDGPRVSSLSEFIRNADEKSKIRITGSKNVPLKKWLNQQAKKLSGPNKKK